MILFSSFSHIWILILFIYLGLSSGIIFFSASVFLEKFKLFLLKPRENKNRKIHNFLVFHKEGESKNNGEQEDNDSKKIKKKERKIKNIFVRDKSNLPVNENEQNKKLRKKNKKTANNGNEKKENVLEIFYKKVLLKIANIVSVKFSKFKRVIISVSLTSIKVLVFLTVIVISYLINLYLNLGYLRFSFILIYIGCFIIAKSVIKLLANYFTNFYNYFKKIIFSSNKRHGK